MREKARSSWLGNPEMALKNPEPSNIKLHGAEGFAGMRAAGRLGAEVLDYITPHVAACVTTGRLD